MKRNLFLVIIFACFCVLQSAAQRASIAVARENTVYIGIDNPITIAVENYPCNSIIAKSIMVRLKEANGNTIIGPKMLDKQLILFTPKLMGN